LELSHDIFIVAYFQNLFNSSMMHSLLIPKLSWKSVHKLSC